MDMSRVLLLLFLKQGLYLVVETTEIGLGICSPPESAFRALRLQA